MKRYLITPQFKKSVVELQYFQKIIKDTTVVITYQETWRWGSFTLDVPETQEEINRWLLDHEEAGYDSLDDYLEDHGVESIEQIFLPKLDDEHVLLTEDYGTYCEMVDTRDSCAIYFTARCHDPDALSKEELEIIADEFEEGWAKDYIEYVKENGWEDIGHDYEIVNGFELKEFDGDYSAI